MSDDVTHSVTIKNVELERLIFFSDAVFAIAITLLVLELRPPERVETGVDAALVRGLLRTIPAFVSYAFSFWLIALYWVVHHRIFRHVRRWDDGLIFRNFVFLFWIAFLPFPVALMGRFGDRRVAVVFYAAVLLAIALSQLMLWRYCARGHRLIDPSLPEPLIRKIEARSLAPAVACVVVAALALLGSPAWASAAFMLIVPAQRLIERRFRSAPVVSDHEGTVRAKLPIETKPESP